MTSIPSPLPFPRPGFRPRRAAPRAFSLVEVVLALGITGFSCVTLMGLLGTGLTTFSAARQATMQAQILQDVFASTRVQDYPPFTPASQQPFSLPTRYFNVEGAELFLPPGAAGAAPAPGATPPPGTVYTATAQAVTDPLGTQLPGPAPTPSQTYCRLKVDVAAVSDPYHHSSFTILWPEYAVPTPTPAPAPQS